MDEEEEAHANLNTRGLFLHVLADALGSVGVIISSTLIYFFQWTVSDAVCSMIISLLIVGSVWPLIRGSALLLLQRAPVRQQRRTQEALEKVNSIEGVIGYREPRFWSLTDSEVVGTLHVHVRQDADEQRVLSAVVALFREHDLVQNLAVQIEKEKFLLQMDPQTRMQMQMNGYA